MEEINVTLISGRTSQQGVGLEVGKTSEAYRESASYVELNPEDAGSLGVEAGGRVKVKTAHGSVVVSAKVSESLDPGTCFFPYGIWANQVFGSGTGGTGMPQYKGIAAKVRASKSKVLSVESLVAKLKEAS